MPGGDTPSETRRLVCRVVADDLRCAALVGVAEMAEPVARLSGPARLSEPVARLSE